MHPYDFEIYELSLKFHAQFDADNLFLVNRRNRCYMKYYFVIWVIWKYNKNTIEIKMIQFASPSRYELQ